MSTEPNTEPVETPPVSPRSGAIGAPAQQASAPFSDIEAGQKVRYCVNRPYAAGEHVDITDAEITSIDLWAGVASLEYVVSSAVTVEKDGVPYSEGREPGTWHRAVKEATPDA